MLVSMLPELVRNGHEVTVGVLRPPLDLAGPLQSGGVRVELMPQHGKWRLHKGARNVASQSRRTRPAIIHAHLTFPAVYTGLARALGLTDARTCVTYHNLAYAHGANKPGLGLTLRRQLNGLASRHGIDGHLAVSRATADHYAAALGLQKVEVIPNPIPVLRIGEAVSGGEAAGKSSAAGRATHILLPGRLVHEKGHAVLIEALALLNARGFAVTAEFAGDGPLRHRLQTQLGTAGLSEAVSITGRLEHNALMRRMAAADIVAVPSLFEGFGMTAAEAMAAGSPVIATRTGGLVDIVEDGVCGLLVPPGDAEALAGAIVRLADAPQLCASLASAARDRVKEHFDVTVVVRQLIAFYERLLSKSDK